MIMVMMGLIIVVVEGAGLMVVVVEGTGLVGVEWEEESLRT